MSRWYLDTSAAAKLLVREAESAALVALVNEQRPELVASQLLETELRRMCHRREGLEQKMVTGLLERVELHPLGASIYTTAGLLPGPALRSLDALHLAAALALTVDAMVAYDHRLIDAARDVGLVVLSPQ